MVAHHLGVDADELAPEVSLTRDLAADSLDLAELALGLEAEFAITVPQHVLDHVQTYRELVGAVVQIAEIRALFATGSQNARTRTFASSPPQIGGFSADRRF